MKETKERVLVKHAYIDRLESENKNLRARLKLAEKLLDKDSDNKSFKNNDGVLYSEYFDLAGRDHMYRILIENMSEGALVLNKKHMIVYGNKQFADFSGYPLEKVIGSDINSFLDESDRNTLIKCLEASKTKKSFCELNLIPTHDKKNPVLASVKSFQMDSETYYCLIITDISFHKEIETGLEFEAEERALELATANRQLNNMNLELSNVNKYLDNFVHAIAHDLRAPVANLKLVEEIFQHASGEKKEKLLSSIHKNIHRLDLTLKGLVQIIDMQGDRETIKDEIDVKKIVNEIIEELQDRIRSLDATIIVNIETDQAIRYVEGYLRSIIRNLMSNSLKYTSPDRNPIIEIQFVKNKRFSKLSIQDNGTGMDLTKREKNLFKPFQRFSPKSGGMGIGLHIVNNMVTRNGGNIIVQSKPGEGTKFILNLKEYDT